MDQDTAFAEARHNIIAFGGEAGRHHPSHTVAKHLCSRPDYQLLYESCIPIHSVNATLFPDELKRNLVDEVYNFYALHQIDYEAAPHIDNYQSIVVARMALLTETAWEIDGGPRDRDCMGVLGATGWAHNAFVYTKEVHGSVLPPPGVAPDSWPGLVHFHDQIEKARLIGEQGLDERDRKFGRLEGDSFLDEESERARGVGQEGLDGRDKDGGRTPGLSYLSICYSKIVNLVLDIFWRVPIP